MTCQWGADRCYQLSFWTQLLGMPSVYEAAPTGFATWYKAILEQKSFLGKKIPWDELTLSDTFRPIKIKFTQFVLKQYAITALNRSNILTIDYNAAEAILTINCLDAIEFVACLHIIRLVNQTAVNTNNLSMIYDDTVRQLNISLDSAKNKSRNERARYYYAEWYDDFYYPNGKAKVSYETKKYVFDTFTTEDGAELFDIVASDKPVRGGSAGLDRGVPYRGTSFKAPRNLSNVGSLVRGVAQERFGNDAIGGSVLARSEAKEVDFASKLF
jgi:hypothetical protein